jgi:hypothetical protein
MSGGSTFQVGKDGQLVEVFPDGTSAAISPMVLSGAAPSESSQQPKALTRAAPQKKRSTRDIVRELRARLRDVEGEIRTRKTLETERDQLRRLIAAAQGKTIAPVRELKRSAG